MAYSVLITRPIAGARALANLVRAELGEAAQILCSPLLRIEPLKGNLPDLGCYRGLILTSAYAVEPIAKNSLAKDLCCYCVGSATAEAAHAAKLQALAGSGTAKALIAELIEARPTGPLLYVRGEHVSTNLVAALNNAGLETHEAIVYRQLSENLTENAKRLLEGSGPVILPLFSARTARMFFGQATSNPNLRVVAISSGVARAVPCDENVQVTIAPEPTLQAMVETITAIATST